MAEKSSIPPEYEMLLIYHHRYIVKPKLFTIETALRSIFTKIVHIYL